MKYSKHNEMDIITTDTQGPKMTSTLQDVVVTLGPRPASTRLRREITKNGFEPLENIMWEVLSSYTPESSVTTLANPYTEALYRLA